MRDSRDPEYQQCQLTVSEVYPRRAIYGFRLAPDSRMLSFVYQHDKRVFEEVIGDRRKRIKAIPLADLYLIPSEGSFPQPLTNYGDIANPAAWSPRNKKDGGWLAFEYGEGLQIMPLDGGQMRTIYKGQLYHPPLEAGDSYLGDPRWSPDGELILFATYERSQTSLRCISRDGRLHHKLLSVRGYISGWDWSPDGRHVVVVTRSEDSWVSNIRLVNTQSGSDRALMEGDRENIEDKYEYQKPVAVWAPDGEHIVFRSNRSGWAKLWVATLDGRASMPLTYGEWDDYAFRLSPDGQQVVYASRAEQDGNGSDLWIIPLSGGDPRRITQHRGVNVPLGWSEEGRIYYWHSSPVEPSDLWFVSINDRECKRITFSTPIGLTRKLRNPEEVVISSEDGTSVPTLIYLPTYYKDDEKYPAIVWVRGGPTAMSRFEFNPFYNWLANLGFVVINPNYRGSIGNGVKYMEAVTCEGLGKNDLSDILAAGKYAKTLKYVDVTRGVGVGGQSWGGYLTLMAVTQAPDDFSCAVAGAAISDWFIQQSETKVRYYDRWLIGDWVYQQPRRAQERSPIHYVDRIKVPLLVYHGEEDQDVPFRQSERFVEKARQVGVDVDCFSYPMEEHSNKKPENQEHALGQLRAFFRRHLQPWNFHDNPSAEQEPY